MEPIMMDRFKAMTERTQEVLRKAETLYGVKINPTIAFNLRGRVAGFASCKFCMLTGKANQFTLRFNREIIQGDHFDDMMNFTVPHECAHLVAMAKPELGARGHNEEWKRICLALGGNGKRTHNYDVVVKGRWDYVTDRGNKVSVTKKYHAYVQAGGSLSFKRGLGQITKTSPHAPSGQLKVTPKADGTVVVRIQPKPVTVPVAKAPRVQNVATRTVEVGKTGDLTWAEKVRRLIRAQKALGVSQDTVIVLAIQDLGMTRERARSCVKAHWEKV
jgi:predicted SprT family Zn-dependent metalloprotease